MRLALILLLVAGACAKADPPKPDGTIAHFPDSFALVDQTALPDLFRSYDGSYTVQSKEDFTTWRRRELLALFDHYEYGTRPPMVSVATTRTAAYADIVPGALWEEFDLVLGGDSTAVLHLALITPTSVSAPPVVLGLNKCGNQSLHTSAQIRQTTGLTTACDMATAERGGQSSAWPLADIVARGYAVATFHDGDAAADDLDHFGDKLRARFPVEADENSQWGAVSIWAWSLAHAARWLETSGKVDPDRITVFGHSRRGKAALLAAVISPEIDSVVAHQSGTAGAALHRSPTGESIELITSAFPHWFAPRFREFSGRELATPVDQHQLLALIAPRRVVLVDGEADTWADPEGARQAAEAAGPAWKLFGKEGYGKEIVWKSRPGVHEVRPSDWTLFLDGIEGR